MTAGTTKWKGKGDAMKKLMLVAVLLAPLAAFAQAGGGPGPGPGADAGPGSGMGPGVMGRHRAHGWDAEGDGQGPGVPGRRAKLALTLGLAEALDLDDAQALKLRQAVEAFHQKRQPLHQQMREAMQVVRKAADGEKVEAAAVDQAVAKVLDLRAQAQAADKELLQAVTKDQPPQKKARAVIFLSRFHQRMDERMGPAGRMGQRGMPGMRPGSGRGGRTGPGRGMGPCDPDLGPGMGPGMMPGGKAGPAKGTIGELEGVDDPLAALDLPPPPPEDDEEP